MLQRAGKSRDVADVGSGRPLPFVGNGDEVALHGCRVDRRQSGWDSVESKSLEKGSGGGSERKGGEEERKDDEPDKKRFAYSDGGRIVTAEASPSLAAVFALCSMRLATLKTARTSKFQSYSALERRREIAHRR